MNAWKASSHPPAPQPEKKKTMKKLLILTITLLTGGLALPAAAEEYRPKRGGNTYISGYHHCGTPIYSKRHHRQNYYQERVSYRELERERRRRAERARQREIRRAIQRRLERERYFRAQRSRRGGGYYQNRRCR